MLRAISPFPTVFSKDLKCRHVKTRACLGKGAREVKTEICFEKGLPAFSPFPTMFSKGSFPSVVKSSHCVVMG